MTPDRHQLPEKYDVIDEALLDVPPEAVYQAVVDEYDGKTDWWMPHRSAALRHGASFDSVGAVCDVTIRGKWPIKFTTRTVGAEENQSISVVYTDGALRGEGLWRCENEGGKTRVSYRWRTTPAGGLRLLAPVLPVSRHHSRVMEEGFRSLCEFLEAPEPTELRSRPIWRAEPRRPSPAVALVLISAIGGAVYLLRPWVRARGR